MAMVTTAVAGGDGWWRVVTGDGGHGGVTDLVDGHSADRHGCVTHDPFTSEVNVLAGG